MSELEIFKKHLGNVDGKGTFEARELGIQIADTNDFIAALQIVDSVLKKLIANIKTPNPAEFEMQNLALIKNASFLGEAVFGAKFSTSIGVQKLEFEIADPFFAFKDGEIEGVLAYIEDKRDEISMLFDKLEETLNINNSFEIPKNLSFGYKELFR